MADKKTVLVANKFYQRAIRWIRSTFFNTTIVA
jgi:hypothetical protein